MGDYDLDTPAPNGDMPRAFPLGAAPSSSNQLGATALNSPWCCLGEPGWDLGIGGQGVGGTPH